jgi:hypothetical protein
VNRFTSIASLTLALTVSIFSLYGSSDAATLYKVVRVTDGDTIKLRVPGLQTEIIVRLVGIDTPETSKSKRQPGQPFSQTATKHLAALVLNKAVSIREYGMIDTDAPSLWFMWTATISTWRWSKPAWRKSIVGNPCQASTINRIRELKTRREQPAVGCGS